ncbi:MAG TPA: hypothetical protein VFZ79_15455 [Acidimicrobiales bacterium]
MLVAAGLLAPAACASGDGDNASDLADRRAEVAERGAAVMPFDLDATTHVFEPRDDGLVQHVVVDDPGDAEQVALVREHLTGEVERFAAGDFGDPAAIHGHDMPGLAELEGGHEEIDVRYAEMPEGGRIDYTTDDPDLVAALHAWGEAQVSDHGAHAEHGDGDAGS